MECIPGRGRGVWAMVYHMPTRDEEWACNHGRRDGVRDEGWDGSGGVHTPRMSETPVCEAVSLSLASSGSPGAESRHATQVLCSVKLNN